jgi:hypothetical protein
LAQSTRSTGPVPISKGGGPSRSRKSVCRMGQLPVLRHRLSCTVQARWRPQERLNFASRFSNSSRGLKTLHRKCIHPLTRGQTSPRVSGDEARANVESDHIARDVGVGPRDVLFRSHSVIFGQGPLGLPVLPYIR